MTKKPTDADIINALEGREEPKLSDFDFSLDTPAVTESASAFNGYDFSLDDKPDPFKAAADVRLLEAMGEPAPRNADPLWMERSEVNLAVNAYRDARLKSLPHAETFDGATREAERERDRFMAAHRPEHASEAALLEATATHLTGLAAVHRKPAAERKAPATGPSRSTVYESAPAGPSGPDRPGPSPEMTRLYRAMDTYRDSIRRDNSREAFRNAAERTSRERKAFMDANRSKYPNEAALQMATAQHLNLLAIEKN